MVAEGLYQIKIFLMQWPEEYHSVPRCLSCWAIKPYIENERVKKKKTHTLIMINAGS